MFVYVFADAATKSSRRIVLVTNVTTTVQMYDISVQQIQNTVRLFGKVKVKDTIGLRTFSKDVDRQADVFAIGLMARAGYDPGQLALIAKKLIEFQAQQNGKRQVGYVYEHLDPDRVAFIQAEAAKLKLTPGQVSAGPPVKDQLQKR